MSAVVVSGLLVVAGSLGMAGVLVVSAFPGPPELGTSEGGRRTSGGGAIFGVSGGAGAGCDGTFLGGSAKSCSAVAGGTVRGRPQSNQLPAATNVAVTNTANAKPRQRETRDRCGRGVIMRPGL
jgi:hypothetical protein